MQWTRPRARLLAILLATTCAFLMAGAGVAQTINGTVQGYISDVAGDPIPGATVTATNQDTGINRAVITDANGFYSAKALQVGTYTVSAELAGMQTTQQTDISVLVGQIKDINLTLAVESSSEVITVTSEAPIIETSRSGAANYIDEVQIEKPADRRPRLHRLRHPDSGRAARQPARLPDHLRPARHVQRSLR